MDSYAPFRNNLVWSDRIPITNYGPVKEWGDPDVKAALVNFKKVLTYTNSDLASSSWQHAPNWLLTDPAFNVMGDWAEKLVQELGKEPMVDFGLGSGSRIWWNVPILIRDSFAPPTGAPHRDAAIAWLTVAGSKAGQDAFNPVKGSIPARSDGEKPLYDLQPPWMIGPVM